MSRVSSVLVRPQTAPAVLPLAWLAAIARFCRRKPLGALGAVILAALVVAAVFAPQLATESPTKTNLRAAAVAPNAEHWFGTDLQGRDQWSRIVYGARISLRVALISVVA
ncbi:MAG: hypothetical protein C4290_05925, partial [Chloroflexota bacterium]